MKTDMFKIQHNIQYPTLFAVPLLSLYSCVGSVIPSVIILGYRLSLEVLNHENRGEKRHYENCGLSNYVLNLYFWKIGPIIGKFLSSGYICCLSTEYCFSLPAHLKNYHGICKNNLFTLLSWNYKFLEQNRGNRFNMDQESVCQVESHDLTLIAKLAQPRVTCEQNLNKDCYIVFVWGYASEGLSSLS